MRLDFFQNIYLCTVYMLLWIWVPRDQKDETPPSLSAQNSEDPRCSFFRIYMLWLWFIIYIALGRFAQNLLPRVYRIGSRFAQNLLPGVYSVIER